MAREKLKFEQALARLEKLVEGIEQGRIGLEESIERYAEGMELVRYCRAILVESEMKIQKLQLDAAGEAKTIDLPADADEPGGSA